MTDKWEDNTYRTARIFEQDMKLFFEVYFKFWPEGDYIHRLGRELKVVYKATLNFKEKYIASLQAESQTPGTEKNAIVLEDSSDDSVCESPSDQERYIKSNQLRHKMRLVKQLKRLKKRDRRTPAIPVTSTVQLPQKSILQSWEGRPSQSRNARYSRSYTSFTKIAGVDKDPPATAFATLGLKDSARSTALLRTLQRKDSALLRAPFQEPGTLASPSKIADRGLAAADMESGPGGGLGGSTR